MTVLPPESSDEDIMGVVRRWAERLASGDYAGASGLLLAEGAERDWPPALVEEIVSTHGRLDGVPAAGPRVTPDAPVRPDGRVPLGVVARWGKSLRPGVVGDVHYSLPLDGEWSDLVAIFFLREVPGGLALELFDLHVL